MPNRIKRRLLIPLAIALLVLLGTTIAGLYQHDQHFLDQEVRTQITRAKELFHSNLKKDAELMSGLITFLKREPCLQPRFLAADREGLLNCTKSLFEKIRRDHRITHFYFHTADQVNFLRIHNPPRFGDHIGRFTMKEAVKEGKNAYGIELGPFGTFTLRTVSPWYVNGEIIGYIELGEEIEHITPEIKHVVGVDLILLIDKKYLAQKSWQKGLQMMGKTGDWDQIPDLVIIDRTLNIWTPELETFTRSSHHHNIANNTVELESNGQQYLALGTPLTDAGDRHLGHFLILKQITGADAARWALLAPTAITALTIVTLLFIFSSIYLGRIQRMLIQTHTQLQTKLKEHEEAEQLLLENEQKLSTEITHRKNAAREEKALGDILGFALQPLTMKEYLQQTLNTLTSSLLQLDAHLMGAIFLTQDEGQGDALELIATHSLSPEHQSQCRLIPFGICLCGKAAASGEQSFSDCPNKQHSIKVEGLEPHSHIITPIIHGSTVLGVINLYLPPDYKQTKKTAAFLARAANALSVGILRRYTDRSLQAAMTQAEAASKAKSDFLATMSHEIRTPMNGVLGMAELLQDTSLNPGQREFVDIINRSGHDLLTIINDILDFSKAEAGHLALEIIPFDLENSVYEITQLLSAQAEEKGLELILHYGYDCPRHLMADAGRVRQVLLNLITNAIKFTKEGHVLIEVRSLEQIKGNATIRVSVQDTGIGIAPEKQHLLFDSFTQADSSTTREYGGTGLGLAICNQIINLMDGDIGIDSTPGKGSTFWFTVTLPMAVAPQPLPQAELKNARILVVDDNQTNLHMLHEQLSNFGMRVETTASPQQALNMLRTAAKAGAPYSLALLDYLMPGMDGEQLGRTILADEDISSVSLLLFTSAARRGDGEHFKELGFSAYLSKPVLQDTLRRTLASMLATREQEDKKAPFITRYQVAETLVKTDATSQQFSGRILLAEDNIVNQKVALSMLRKLGFYIETANDGQEAVEYWLQGGYDLVLMDCQMPKLDGYKATQLIREKEQEQGEGQHIPIVALTANAMVGANKKCLDAGMDDYIAKPFKQSDLINTLQKWLT